MRSLLLLLILAGVLPSQSEALSTSKPPEAITEHLDLKSPLILSEASQKNDSSSIANSSNAIQPQPTSTEKSPSVKEQGNVINLIKNGAVYEIPIILNEVLKINVIIDSGASDVLISSDVALTLIKTGTIDESDWLPGKIFKFANGSEAKSYNFRLKSLKIGNKVFDNIPCTIINSTDAPMLLGQSVLKRLGKYTFDYKKGTLEFK